VKILVKLSGKVLESRQLRGFLSDQVKSLESRGMKIFLVHGAGKQLSEYCGNNNIPVIQKGGRRVTSLPVIQSAAKVFSSVNRDITASLLSAGVKAVGFSAFDGNLTTSRKRPPIAVEENGDKIDFGYVAELEKVEPELITVLWDSGFTPIVSCLCADSTGQLLNINADTLATELATALVVDSLVSVSDVEGLFMDLDDPESLIRGLSLEDARRLLAQGIFSDGMIPKIQNAISALERGVPNYHVVSGLSGRAVIDALEGKAGTRISV